MDTAHILCTLKNVTSFLGVYPSDILPPPSVTPAATLIVNSDPQTSKGTHWLAIHCQPRSYSGYFFDSYGLPPLIPNISNFLRRNCTVWKYNSTQIRVSPVQSAANIAVYQHSTWTSDTLLNALWASWIPPSPTGRSTASSHRDSDRYPRRIAGVSAAPL